MNRFRLILASLVHYRRIHIAVGLGVAVATAVLSGALLVGDSVRGSLRHIALDRLGRIDEVLLTERFFRAELASELLEEESVSDHFDASMPAMLLRGTLENPDPDARARAGDVTIVGCDDRFWKLATTGPQPEMGEDAVLLNAPLADELGVAAGDEITLRIPLESEVPAETPLGEKQDTLRSRRLKVSGVIAAEGLGRFGLRPSQHIPLNAYVSLSLMQSMLEQPGQVNAVLVAGGTQDAPSAEASEALAGALRRTVRPEDMGLKIERIRIGKGDPPVQEYFNITSREMFLPPPVVDAAKEAFADEQVQLALTYLANTITSGDQKIPYSTVAGLEPNAELSPFPSLEEPLTEDEIVLNRWAADDLAAQVGDEVRLTYYDPESTHGELEEPEPAVFTLRAIVPLAEPPTRANDPHLTPELAGVTDQETIDDWDLPFELTEEIRDQDETYWENYRATPKAFISLAAARKLWNSRFGDTTSIRMVPSQDLTPAAIFERLELDPARLGFLFRPVKRNALQASAGTTSFDGLFIGFSFFIIAAALMLIALLFRLGVEQRAAEVGLESAVGLQRRSIAAMLVVEGLIVSAVGALAGVLAGVGYAWLMILGLRTWWVEAIVTPFLHLHVTAMSIVVGYVAGVSVSFITIVLAVLRFRRTSVRRLLAGQAAADSSLGSVDTRLSTRLAQGALILAVLIALIAIQLSGEAQAGAFFGSGTLTLVACLTWIRARLRRGGAHSENPASTLLGLAARNGARNPGRSTLTIGLVAAASFLIIAISAFRLDPNEKGAGGFTLLAESVDPIVHNLNTEDGRFELGFSNRAEEYVSRCEVFSIRVRAGDDASCLNLYRPQQPKVYGLPEAFLDRGGFAWAASAAESEEERQNPWLLLEQDLQDAVPVVIDQATATYSLKPAVGVGDLYEMPDGEGGTIRFQVVGLLKNSLLQGALLTSEEHFLRLFPEVSGYRFFLIDVPNALELSSSYELPIHNLRDELTSLRARRADTERIKRAEKELERLRSLWQDRERFVSLLQSSLEETLGEKGFDTTLGETRLAGLMAVQNTYLSTFQSLGALGLLLGTFGLATVQLRNVLERRSELALMRAAGFRRGRLAGLVMWENAMLLAGGLGTGVLAALVAVFPHLVLGGAGVPWMWLAAMLGVIFLAGFLAGLAAVRAVLRAPLLESLRSE